MTVYIRKVDENKNKNTVTRTMSVKVNDKQLLENYAKYGKILKD